MMKPTPYFIPCNSQRTSCSRVRYLLVVLLAGMCSTGFNQKKNVRFEHLNINSGLSQSNVLCTLQDSRGFIWFGTQDGLNKYDGYRFTVYKKDSKNSRSLGNNYIKDIIEDNSGDLWIATWGGGLDRYDRQKDEFIHYRNDEHNTNTLSGNFLVSLLKDSENKIWIGTEFGIDVFNPKTSLFIHYKKRAGDESALSDNTVTNMMEDSQQNIWIGTSNGGLNMFDKKNNVFTHFKHHDQDPGTISSNNIWTIFEDSKQNIWVGTVGAGLNLLDRKTGKFRVFKKTNTGNSICDNVIFSIVEDNDGILWIGSENEGISKLDTKTGIFQNYRHNDFDNNSLSSSSINRIYKDINGNIWIATYNAGINFINYGISKFTQYKHSVEENSLSNDNVLCIYEDNKENLWIGTDGGGLNMFDRNSGKFTNYKHQENNKNTICGNYVLSVIQDGEDIWIGTWGNGLTVFNRQKNTFKHYKNNPQDSNSLIGDNGWVMLKDHENNIWIGVQGKGLCRYDRGNDRFIHYTHENNNLSSNNILTLFEDKDGMLWVGTDGGGLNLFDWKKNKISQVKQSDQKNSLSDNSINCIFENETGNLWLGTNDGLNYLDRKTNNFTIYTTKDGLPNDVIFGILQDSNKNLWISTNKGISQFNPITKKFKNFGIEDGLQSNEFKQSYCKSRSGLMYFGGINGFNEFNPDSIKEITFDPKLVITDFRIANKDVPIAADGNDPSPLKKNITETTEIILPYYSSFFSFEFASLNYISPEKKQYAYMLEGFDKTWNEIGTQRIATYTNLDPGKYVFKVKGLNNEGEWSQHIVSIQITITPPFWLTWWFKILVFISIIGGAVGFYKFRMHNIKAQKAKLEQRVQEQTQQLKISAEEEHKAREDAEQANMELEIKNKEMEQFAYIASHDLQEPLRTTSSFVALLQKQYQGQLDDKADKYITYILEASERMKVLIKSLLDFSRIGHKKELERVDCDQLLHNVLADLGTAITEAGAAITSVPLPVINGYSSEVKQLFQNLVINAIKFRKKGVPPVLNITVQKNKSYWKFAFRDNGIGIDEEHHEKIFVIFQRLHTRTEYQGSGIGLSHCKKIVELHKGKIWVESKPGEGSTFYFTLPVGKSSVSQIQ